MAKRSTSKREEIDTGRNKMLVKRTVMGQFEEMDERRLASTSSAKAVEL